MSNAKQRVLDVAEALFMRCGYNAITLRDIADELGMKQASLYYHFPNGKEELYVAVARRVFQRYRDGITAAAEAGQPVDQRLHAVAGWFAAQPQINLSSMMHADMPALAPEEAAALGAFAYECMFIPLRQIFIDGEADGQLRYVNPDVLAGSFLAIMDGLSFSQSDPTAPPRQAVINDVISMMLDGLRIAGPAAVATPAAEGSLHG